MANKNNAAIPWIISFILFVVVVVESLALLAKSTTPPEASSPTATITPIKSPSPTPTKKEQVSGPINQQYMIDLDVKNSSESAQIKYLAKDYKITNEVYANGIKANTINGRQYLFINLELTNNSRFPLQINSRAYIRLAMNNDDRLYAPDSHDDPIDLQTGATREAEVGFAIDESDSDFILYLGDPSDDLGSGYKLGI